MDIETATATPRSEVSVTVTARDLTLIQDKPETSGGDNAGMMASELLLAALLGCQHSTFVKVAAKRRLDAKIVRLDGAMAFENDAITKIDVTYVIESDAPDAKLETAVRLTDKACTISKALSVPVHVQITRQDAS